MKKFLIFLVSLVVVVCVGLTTYYFMRNNEIITVKTKEIYCNAGDTIPLASLGIDIKRANVSKKTAFDYNAGGDEVTKYIKYDDASNSFVISKENAGEVTLVIRTSNKKYSDFTVNVHIGNGSVENPYYIFNESELMKIGSAYKLDSCYRLMSDITLTSDFQPIGYNSNTSSWSGFNGVFDGQGHTIKALNIVDKDIANAGFFSSLGSNSVVKNLTLANSTISGSYVNAGILAGVSNGEIDKVVVKNGSITNTAVESVNGSMVGTFAGNAIKLSYSENITLNIGSEDVAVTNALVGGFVGKVDESIVQACYSTDISINTTNATVSAGGFVGEVVIGTESGSIQQSYANTTSTDANFGAFIGKVTKNATFDSTKANMLRYFIGNIAVVYGRDNQASILDSDLVKSYDNSFFKNSTFVNHSVFFDKEAALYLIRGYAGAGDVVSTNEFIYYAIDSANTTPWDTTYVWDTTHNSLPTLRMGSIYPSDPSGEYFRRDLTQKVMGNKETFVDTFSTDVENQSIKLLSDVDLTNGWTPVSVKNTTIDGNNKTIRINLNNAANSNLGLFKTIDNCTIKNLNIVVTGVSANAANGGALAGLIMSSENLAVSTIENVKVTYENNFATPVITNFGGLAGTIENTIVKDCDIVSLIMNSGSSVENAGAIAGHVKQNTQINNCEIYSSTVYGTKNIGGVAGNNEGTITAVSGTVNVKSNSVVGSAVIGGVVATNSGSIDNVDLTPIIVLDNIADSQKIGGIAGVNNGKISNTKISGEGIKVNSTKTNVIYIGGVVGENNGTIESITNRMITIGTCHVGSNHYVGGVASINNGTISKVLIDSDIAGNYTSGVVAQMNKSTAVIDQVVVGNYNSINGKLSENTIRGDKYVAGIVVDFKSGKITNIQASSTITGETNSTRSSLVALIFPYGATLKSATINSSFAGYGETYRETWTDFASFNNKAEFGLANGETGDERFNLYKYDTYHGIMQSVVINGAKKGVSDAKAAMGAAFAWGKDYQDTSDSSFIKVVNGFNDVSQFQGSFEFICAVSTLFGIEHKATKTLDFEIGGIWSSNNGISLKFLNNLKF